MKRRFCTIFIVVILFPLLAACKQESYAQYVSEIKSDVFCAQTEQFSLTISCSSREYPYADDGVPCPMSNVIEATLTPVNRVSGDVAVYAADQSWGGEASFSSVHGDYRFSQGVTSFPAQTIDVTVTWGNETYTIAATSVRTKDTLSPDDALDVLVKNEHETLSRMYKEGVFCAEIRIRLMRRDKNYYYTCVTNQETQISLLIDAQTGEILARRAT